MRRVFQRVFSFLLFLLPVLSLCNCQCSNTSPEDDSYLVDFDNSTAWAAKRLVIGYPGSQNIISVTLRDASKKRIKVQAMVRVLCRGADVARSSESLPLGKYRFFAEPKPDANIAICAVTIGNRLLPIAVRFDIAEPCAEYGFEAENERSRILAEKYAPVIYQDAGRFPRADFITAVDFDNNIDPIDNRENLNAHALVGTVYFSVIETHTHAFINYSVFHTMNYGWLLNETADSIENDMTGLVVVVDKAAKDSPPLLVATYAHDQFLHYSSSDSILPGSERIKGKLRVENTTHPRVFIEAGRHGCLVTSDLVIGEYTGEAGDDFPGGKGIVYRFKKEPTEPEGPNDRDAGYRLAPILETIWKLKGFVGDRSVFHSNFRMDDGCEYPERFVSSTPGKRGGRPPWAWDDIDDEGIRIGEMFLIPADVISKHLTMPAPFDRNYSYNPYLGIY
jgi:hypothetical protein